MNDVDRLAWTLIHFVWQGALVAALYAVARQCMARRASPNARYLLAWIALALMSVAPLLTWVALRPAAPVSAVHAEIFLASPPAAPAVAAAGPTAPAAAMGRELVPPALLPWIAALWCSGALFFWMRLTMGWLWAARLRATCVNPAPGEWQATFARLQARMQVSRPVRLLVSARATAPAVVGWLRPVVLAPACAFTGLAPDQMEAVLLHELAHIRRHDYLINLWQNAVEALLFYHPAVWWVSGHMRAEREFCCDDMAVAASGDALSYARALAELESSRPRRPELAVAANGGSLLRRIARLLGPSHAGSPAGPGLAAPVVLAGAMLLCLAGFHGWSQAAPARSAPAGTLSPARAQTAAKSAEPAIAAASVRWLCTGRCTGFSHSPEAVDPMRLSCDRCLVEGMIQQAYGLKFESQMEGAPEWMAWDRYNFEVASASPVSRSQMDQVLSRRVLAQCFSLRTREVTKTVPGYALVVAPGGIKFPAVKKPSPYHFEKGVGHLSTLPQLATVLSQWYYDGKLYGVTRPVQDATGLRGFYDIRWTVMPEPGTNLLAALGPLGLQVKPAHATETKLQILHIDHLRTNCEIGPSAVPPGN